MNDRNELNCLNQGKESDSDSVLCRLAQQGDRVAEEQLVCRYARLVKSCARTYFLAGADGEDLIQEGMLGLLKAVRAFDERKGVPFEAFAHLCIKRRLLNTLKYGEHRGADSQTVFIGEPLFDDKDAASAVSAPISDPMLLVIGMEEQRELKRQLSSLLSVFEAKVLELFLEGYSYEEMSRLLGKSIKSVDNAIQRIRRKSAKSLSGRMQGETCTHISI